LSAPQTQAAQSVASQSSKSGEVEDKLNMDVNAGRTSADRGFSVSRCIDSEQVRRFIERLQPVATKQTVDSLGRSQRMVALSRRMISMALRLLFA
jgi:hypothetical protein